MSACASRRPGYKAGVGLLLVATVLYIVGFASPFWVTSPVHVLNTTVDVREGMWQYCATVAVSDVSVTICRAYGLLLSGFPYWFQAARLLGCLCVVGLGSTCVFAVITNCRSAPGPRRRIVEIYASGLGVLGFVGCIVYVSLRSIGRREDETPTTEALTYFSGLEEFSMGWAFYLATAGSFLCVVAGVLVAVSNKPGVEPPAVVPGDMVMGRAGVTGVPQGAAPGPYDQPRAGYGQVTLTNYC